MALLNYGMVIDMNDFTKTLSKVKGMSFEESAHWVLEYNVHMSSYLLYYKDNIEKTSCDYLQIEKFIFDFYGTEKKLAETLKGMLELWCNLVNSGDAGNWNPEEDEPVIKARKALKDAGFDYHDISTELREVK